MLIPRGLIGRLATILGCRALVLLPDEHGHPLLATTHRGDQHLMVGLPSIIARYAYHQEHIQVKRIMVDREGMETLVPRQFAGCGTNRADDLTQQPVPGSDLVLQWRNLSSASVLTPKARSCEKWLLPASLCHAPPHPGEQLCLRVALMRDLRRLLPVVPDPEDIDLPRSFDADRERTDPRWWEAGWQATAAPAKEMTAKLIPIVTTAPTIAAVELAQTYIHRWPAQENVSKDYLLPLGLDTDHGFAKVAVENSEVAKRRTQLEQRQSRLKQWAHSASKREAQESLRHERLRKEQKRRADELYRELGL